jgi:hypothetical protein
MKNPHNAITIIQTAEREDFEYSHHKEMVNIGSDGYANCPNLIITKCTHVSK